MTETEITKTGADLYRVRSWHDDESIAIRGAGLLEIAAYVEQHREELLRAQEEVGQTIVEYVKQSMTAISTESTEFDLTPRVDLVSLVPTSGIWEAVLRIAGGRFDLRVLFWIEEHPQPLENRLHIKSQRQENHDMFLDRGLPNWARK